MHKKIFLMMKWMMLAFALFFSVNAFAEDPTQEDIDSAYSYFSNISGSSIPAATNGKKKPIFSPHTEEKTAALPGVGGVAANLIAPVDLVSRFLYGMSIVIGIMCLFAAFARYMQYRVNPLANPIGTVVTLFILGVLLIVLPLVYKFTESGVPPSLG